MISKIFLAIFILTSTLYTTNVYSATQTEQDIIDDTLISFCEDTFQIYESVGKDQYLEMLSNAPFPTKCVMLYSDSIWGHEGEDRVDVLIKWLTDEIQKQTKPISENDEIPQWIKNNAGWWSDGSIGDSEFISGIQFLIKEKILLIPETARTSTPEAEQVPAWIKNNADWWSKGLISDGDFIKGIQYLVKQGIIIV